MPASLTHTRAFQPFRRFLASFPRVAASPRPDSTELVAGRVGTAARKTLFYAAALATLFHTLPSKVPAAEPKTARSLAEELPRIPAVEPGHALDTFRVLGGFRLELVASEPLVASPVDACFDEDGRMYVAEMRDYPFSWEPTKLNPRGGGRKDAGTVRLLEDTHGDGRFDRSVIFADRLTWPTSVCCYRGGVFVLAPPNLYYLKDTNGDGVADVRRIVLSGFGRDNVQAVANNLKWSLQNRIVFAAGRNGGKLIRDSRTVLTIRGQDISFDPATLAFCEITGGEQFGLCFDDWGNRFVCNNSNHIEQVLFEEHYLRRNPYAEISDTIRTIAKEGLAAAVFRRSPPEPWRVVRTRRRVSDPAMLRTLPRTEQFAVGYFTSAAGVTIYRGDTYPPDFRGNAFIGDVGGNLVHRKVLSFTGPLAVARRADADAEFVASTDNWFRPVNFVNAPDGTLYIVDMYRETIEHPYSIPDDIKAYLDLQSGDDRGRIYRLVAPGSAPRRPPRLGHATSAELVRNLESSNAWNRETAQRLLWERHDKSIVPELEALALRCESPLGRLHALYTLDGLGSLSDRILESALRDADPRLRAHAVRLCESRLWSSSELVAAVSALNRDPDPLVRFQLALSLGEADPEKAIGPLALLAEDGLTDPILRSAIMTSIRGNAGPVALRLLDDPHFANRPGADTMLSELALTVGASANPATATALLEGVFSAKRNSRVQLAVLTGLARGLAHRGASLSALLARDAARDSLRSAAAALFRRAAETAGSGGTTDVERIASIGLLAFAPDEQASGVLIQLLSPQTPAELQLAAVRALAAHRNTEGRQLLAGWKNFGPGMRREVIEALTQQRSRLADLFFAIESKRVARGEIDRDVKQLLMNHPDPAICSRARRVFEADLPSERSRVIANYRAALDAAGNADRGQTVYERRCSICHRARQKGHAVGPDLVSVQNKSPADLLVAILDPSREAQPNYIAYTLVTNRGEIHNGIIAAESAATVTLRRAEGKEDRVLRSEIEELVSTGKSLMPDGFEKDISIAQMADLIAFIKSL